MVEDLTGTPVCIFFRSLCRTTMFSKQVGKNLKSFGGIWTNNGMRDKSRTTILITHTHNVWMEDVICWLFYFSTIVSVPHGMGTLDLLWYAVGGEKKKERKKKWGNINYHSSYSTFISDSNVRYSILNSLFFFDKARRNIKSNNLL